MTEYTTRDVAHLLGLTARQVRSYARAGFITPTRGPRNEYRFSFQDLVLLRTAAGLRQAHVSAQRIGRALRALKRQLPAGQSLSELRIRADGDRVVVSDGEAAWQPESGQFVLDFNVSELAARVTPLIQDRISESRRVQEAGSVRPDAEEWFNHALDLESYAPAAARDAYHRALEIDPTHADAHVNLGRLLHQLGRCSEAAAHYRQALAADPGHALAAFNLGIALEDLHRPADALAAYRQALAARPDLADAHFNLARLLERQGDRTAALRHLNRYRQIMRGAS